MEDGELETDFVKRRERRTIVQPMRTIYTGRMRARAFFLEEHRHRVHLTKLSEILASVACQSSGLIR